VTFVPETNLFPATACQPQCAACILNRFNPSGVFVSPTGHHSLQVTTISGPWRRSGIETEEPWWIHETARAADVDFGSHRNKSEFGENIAARRW